jgi:hypothetical protein
VRQRDRDGERCKIELRGRYGAMEAEGVMVVTRVLVALRAVARRQILRAGFRGASGKALRLLQEQGGHDEKDQLAELHQPSFTFSIVKECAGNV